MMIRTDQHVDDWAEVAVDYLDGQLDQDTRLAVEAHLSGCPECAARLRKQQYVVSVLQEAVLDDPPEDLEYRAIGELVFPSPGAEPIIRPIEQKRVYRQPRWYRAFRAWIPATVAVCALLAAVVGYGIAKSNSGNEGATDAARVEKTTTAVAAAASTTAAAETMGVAGAGPNAETMTTAAAATTMTTAGGAAPTAAMPPQTDSTFASTQDPKAMVRALQNVQTPAYVAFRTSVNTATTAAPSDTTATATDTTAGETTTTAGAEPVGTGDPTAATLSADQATALINEIKQFTGLDPVDRTLWISGPTFAVFLPRQDADELVDLVRSISSTFGLTVTLEGSPPPNAQEVCEKLLGQKKTFPVLEASRALQPSTWNYDFTTSTLTAPGDTGSIKSTPDADGSHVLLVMWIAE